MPDAARVAQAQALEVPVILQGAKTADETGRRELFTENATTTLVFDNGAVLNLRTRLTVGQAIFIHNQQNNREILCKVIEAPAEGQTGLTDLEFTSADPEFWHADAQPSTVAAPNPQAAPPSSQATAPNPEAPAEPPETILQTEAPAEDTLAMMTQSAPNIVMPARASLQEELVPAHEVIPEAAAVDFEPAVSAEADASHATEPTGEQIDAALRQMEAAPPPALPGLEEATGHGEHVEDEKHLAALIARDARFAKFAAIKEKQVDKIQKDLAAKDVPGGMPGAEAESEEVFVPAKPPLMDRLTSGKNAIIVEIVACVVIAIALGFVWHAMRGLFIRDADAPVAAAAAVQPKPKAASASKPASPGAANGSANGTASGNGKNAPATAPVTTQASSKAPPANGTKAAAAPSVKIAPAASGSASTARATDASDAPPVPAAESAAPNSDVVATDGVAEQPKHRKSPEANSGGIVPARIVSQPQPSFPAWAKGLDVDGVVTLEALIDENGNVVKTKPLSGPVELRHAAEQAVGLWEFEPALSAGKPIATYITLTVEFQR